jgi:hypothetical protein
MLKSYDPRIWIYGERGTPVIVDDGTLAANDPLVYFTGLTLPTKEEFVRDTTIPGLIGDKSRSTELKAIDQALDDHHNRRGPHV